MKIIKIIIIMILIIIIIISCISRASRMRLQLLTLQPTSASSRFSGLQSALLLENSFASFPVFIFFNVFVVFKKKSDKFFSGFIRGGSSSFFQTQNFVADICSLRQKFYSSSRERQRGRATGHRGSQCPQPDRQLVRIGEKLKLTNT